MNSWHSSTYAVASHVFAFKVMTPPSCVLEENPKNIKKPPSVRVDMMFQQLQSRFKHNPPKFILCLLADKKFSDLYG